MVDMALEGRQSNTIAVRLSDTEIALQAIFRCTVPRSKQHLAAQAASRSPRFYSQISPPANTHHIPGIL